MYNAKFKILYYNTACILIFTFCILQFLGVTTPNSPVFKVKTLSKGTGVPQKTSDTYSNLIKMFKKSKKNGESLSYKDSMFGLEGERCLCISFDSVKNAIHYYRIVSEMIKGVDLIRIEWTEACK